MKTPRHRSRSQNKRPQWYTRRTPQRDLESVLRFCEVEDALVARGWDNPASALPRLASLAAQAINRTDQDVQALREGFEPWGWLVVEGDRSLVEELQRENPVDGQVERAVSALLDEFLRVATVDEVAEGAIRALKTIAHRARPEPGLPQ